MAGAGRVDEFHKAGFLVWEGVKRADLDVLVATDEHVFGFDVSQGLPSQACIIFGSHQGVQQIVQLLFFELLVGYLFPLDHVREDVGVLRVVRLNKQMYTTAYPSFLEHTPSSGI